jgi:hypothetical protein
LSKGLVGREVRAWLGFEPVFLGVWIRLETLRRDGLGGLFGRSRFLLVSATCLRAATPCVCSSPDNSKSISRPVC